MPYEDPGWRKALVSLVPGFGLLAARRAGEGITRARILFLAYSSSVVYLGVLLVFIVDGPPKDGAWPGVVVGLLGIGGMIGIRWLRRQPLIGKDNRAVAGGFLSALIIGVAFAVTPAVMGFVLSIVQQARWPYVLALPFTLAGMALVAPTRAEIERRQQQMNERGSSIDLGRSLLESPRRR